jgi:hypothetical protein
MLAGTVADDLCSCKQNQHFTSSERGAPDAGHEH